MALIHVRHSVHLTSPAEAEAFFRALRLFSTPRVLASGFHTTDFKRITRVVHAIDPRREHRVDFKDGTLSAGARATLSRLAQLGKYGYFDVQTQASNLRIWPALHSRVHSDKRFPRAFGDADVKVTPHGHDLETTAIDTAVNAFFDVADDRVTGGFISSIKDESKPALLDFLRELQGTVHGHCELELRAARALTELYTGEPLEWYADGVTVRFPEGTIQSFVTSPHTTEDDRAKLLKRLDKVLARAGIRHS